MPTHSLSAKIQIALRSISKEPNKTFQWPVKGIQDVGKNPE